MLIKKKTFDRGTGRTFHRAGLDYDANCITMVIHNGGWKEGYTYIHKAWR